MKISILIPCHNEEKSIRQCIESCLNQTRLPDEIVVVNDGSTDRSAKILKSFGSKIKVINNVSRGNKSYAQEAGLRHVTGEVFATTDADTILHPGFIAAIEKDFANARVAAVGGYVKSLKYNWLTTVRAYDYSIGQNIHKYAQDRVSFMMVIPGAAGAFRTSVFKKYIGFDHDTLTEDLDFTYKLHKNNFKVKYDPTAIVYTQDPSNLHSYINQMRRWYGGGWQNLKKHLSNRLLASPGRAMELTLVYVEGLAFSTMIFIVPLINLVLAFRLFIAFEIIIFLQSIYAAIKERRPDIMLVTFYYPVLMFINAAIFVEQFVKEIVINKRNLIWFHPERVSI